MNNEALEYAAKREAIQRGMSICHTLVTDTQEGKMNALDAFADLKALMGEVADALKEVEPLAMEEAMKYPKTFDHHGLKFTRTDGRRLYNYKHIPEWVEQEAKLKAIEQEAKDAAEQQAKGNIIAGDDGVVKDAAIVTFTKSSLSVK